MTNVLDRTTPKASGNGNGLPPFLLTAVGGDGGNDDEGRYDFVFVDGVFTAVASRSRK